MAQSFEFVSAFAIGWIPYHRKLEEVVPPNAYHQYGSGGRKHRACDLLFYSGNQVPDPFGFQGFLEFKEFLRSKNYRGALALQNVRLHCLDDGTYRVSNETLDLERQEPIGYTPFRFLPKRRDFVFWYAKGQGECKKPRYFATNAGVRLSHEVTFRVGRLANVGAKVLTGYWAPDAWMRVDYEINRDGSGILHMAGSLIPSQERYIRDPGGNCRSEFFHNMEIINELQIQGVLESGPGIMQGNYYRSIPIQGVPI